MYNQRTLSFLDAFRVMDINKFAANQLADARYKSGLSLSDLAAKTGMSVPTLSRLLSGKLKSVSLDNYLTY